MPATTNLVLAGRIEAVPLPAILQLLAHAGRSGVLSVTSDETGQTAEIELVRGKIVRVGLSSGVGSLGEVLGHREVVGPSVLSEALSRQAAAPQWKPLGTVLMEMQSIEPHALADALAEQIERRTSIVLHWDRGVFRFRLGAGKEQRSGHSIGVALGSDELLLEAARRWDEARQLA